MSLAVFIFTTVIIAPLVNSIDYTPQVTIDSGKLRGFIVNVNNAEGAKVRKYLGIPFAKAERFQHPKAPPKWSDQETKDMISFGKACPQLFNPLLVTTSEDRVSEDCLNLNIFVPNDVKPSSKLPVMVWVHGGGFVLGANRQYDGSYLAVLGKVIVVAINYRLSVFGFLTNGNGGDIKGNFGMLDQVEALKWVNRNIEAFNGNPKNVTIFGESAGGCSVSLLMLSKLTKGLFRRAIPQSGDATAPWSSATYDGLSKSTKMFAKLIGCPENLGELRNCLKPKKTMEIMNATLTVPFPSFIPVVDKHFLDDVPNVLYEKQQLDENIDVMMGVTNDEGVVFTNAIGGLSVGLNVTNGVSREAFIQALRGGYISLVIPDPKSVLINATIYRYTDWTDVSSPTKNRRMYVDLQGDSQFVSPAIKGAEAYSKKKATTYFYSLEYRYGNLILGLPIPSWVKANHGADIVFLFGFPLLTENNTTGANFSREMIKLWTNFAKTGNPNEPDGVGITWPQYSHDQPKYLSLKPNMAVNSHLRAEYVAYWNQFISSATPKDKQCPTCSPCAGNDIKATAVMVFLLFVTTWLL